jgi:RTX calcium-binding nonapeptide repeat (4 copies)
MFQLLSELTVSDNFNSLQGYCLVRTDRMLGRMKLRTQLSVLSAAVVLAVSGFFGATVANADPEDGNPSTLPIAPEWCVDEVPTHVGDGRDNLIVGTPGPDVIHGGGGDDVILGLGGHDVILGGFGDDKIEAHGGDDLVCAGEGDDLVQGGHGWDTIYGEAGDDDMYGDDGFDWLIGLAHNEGDYGDSGAGGAACPTTEDTVGC